jgi:hypothetical protein
MNKVWLSNASLEDAEKVRRAFNGVTISLPQPAGGLDTKALCKKGICGLYASAERARELQPQLREEKE